MFSTIQIQNFRTKEFSTIKKIVDLIDLLQSDLLADRYEDAAEDLKKLFIEYYVEMQIELEIEGGNEILSLERDGLHVEGYRGYFLNLEYEETEKFFMELANNQFHAEQTVEKYFED